MGSRIQTYALREVLYERLRQEIVQGARLPRERLKDTALAEELGVSRTPVREAMLRLAKEGFLQADHNRGFRVADLDPVEVRETYPIIAALEVAGLRLAGVPDPQRLEQLQSINARMRDAASADDRLVIDREWHTAMVAASGNERLVAVLAIHKNVVGRYENRYMNDGRRVLESIGEHGAILAALAMGDLDLACRRLEDHWRRGMETVLEWIES